MRAWCARLQAPARVVNETHGIGGAWNRPCDGAARPPCFRRRTIRVTDINPRARTLEPVTLRNRKVGSVFSKIVNVASASSPFSPLAAKPTSSN
jgi:hypothetical protein